MCVAIYSSRSARVAAALRAARHEAIEGFLLTMYDARLRLANQIFDELKGHFGDMVFDTVIPRNTRLSEAPSHGLPAILYDSTSRGATSHMQLAKELLKRNKQ